MPSFAFGSAVTSAGAHASLAPVAVTHAVSASLPASRSACVILCVPVHVIVLPGASVVGIVGEQLKPSIAGLSSTEAPLSVTLPSLVATIVYVITSPTWLYVVGLACFVIFR